MISGRENDAGATSICCSNAEAHANGSSWGPAFDIAVLDNSQRRQKLRVCVVAGDLSSSWPGEIARASLRLASLLRSAGHEVTLLETTALYAGNTVLGEDGTEFEVVTLPEAGPPLYSLSRPLAISYRVYEWLRLNDRFDIVHFADRGGAGFYPICGQRQGLILRQAVTVVGLHGCTATQRSARQVMLRHACELEVDFIERRAAELADATWSVSRGVLDWAQGRGWKLAESTCVRPYPAKVSRESPGSTRARGTIEELVFIGGTNSPKSLLLFLDAVERLAGELSRDAAERLRVTIGGPFAVEGECTKDAVSERVNRWSIPCQLLNETHHERAIDTLRQPGRLAVIVSLVQPARCSVLDCLTGGVPFLAAAVGDLSELIAPQSSERVLFSPNAKALEEKLLDVIHSGYAAADCSFDASANNAEWLAWHEELTAKFHRRAQAHPENRGTTTSTQVLPAISVCITHYNRPRYLRQALRSVAAQSLRPHEVIVVDDGSPTSVQRELDAIESEFDFEARGWKLVRQDNRYLGAARNRATRLASGDYLLFMDDDNVAKPHELATFSKVASHDAADVYACLFDSFEGDRFPGEQDSADTRWLYPGAAQALSVLRNTFGDANALFRREALLAIGGFTEDYGVGHEDWEVFERLMFSGYRIEVIPESLFYYRTSATSMVRTSSIWRNHLRSLRPHLRALPEPYHDLIEMMSGQSVMHWVGSCRRQLILPWSDGMPLEGDDDGSPVLKDALPLRYQIADAINARIKRIRRLHGAGKAVAAGVLSLLRVLVRALTARPAMGQAKKGTPTRKPAAVPIAHVLDRRKNELAHEPHEHLKR